MSEFRQPEFLTENDKPRFRVRCTVHGFIRFSENERQIIDHWYFRRLRYIRQLALTELLYPGASHTRFEHSLGVMEVASRAFDCLALKHGAQMEEAFKEVPLFEVAPLARARQYLRLAALLHDVGHSAFSHAAEKVVHKDMKHEQLSVEIVSNSDRLGGTIDKLFGDRSGVLVGKLIEGGRDLAPQLQVLHDIISGEIDADRTDYLIRDSSHLGVEYGRFDFLRLLESLDLLHDDDNVLRIALSEDGRHALEGLILARYQMNTQVYYHRVRRIYDIYLLEYHKALAVEMEWTVDEVLKNNDVTMTKRLFDDAESGEGDRRKWAQRIVNRDHHRQILETQVDASAMSIRNARKAHQELQKRYDKVEFIFDLAEASIHKQLRETDSSDEGLNELYLIDNRQRKRLAGSASQILSTIPRSFQCGRIFADVDPVDGEKRHELEESAHEFWEERRR